MKTASNFSGAVLFDMDGTLTDTEKIWWEAEQKVCARAGYELKVEEAKMSIGKSLPEAARQIVEYTGIDMTPAEYETELIQLVAQIAAEEGLPWRPGAFELLTCLVEMGIPSALVTSSYHSFARHALRRAPQGSLEVIVSGDMPIRGKPQPDPYLEAAHLLGVDIHNCLAFEDSIPGLYAAFQSGARTFAVPFMVELPRLPGVRFLKSLQEVDADFLRQEFADLIP